MNTKWKEEALSLLTSCMKINTCNPPGNEQALCEAIVSYLAQYGIAGEVLPFAPGRANVVARIAGKDSSKTFLINGHLDTVQFGDAANWQYDPLEPTLKGNILYGRGSSDMKSGLCALLFAFANLVREGKQPQYNLVFLGTADEEFGGRGSEKACEDGLLDNIDGVFIGEPTGNAISIAAKGTIWLSATFKGKTCHSSYPERGMNAAEIACEFMQEVKVLAQESDHELLGKESFTLTKMQAGIANNMVPDECQMVMDIRTLPSTKHALLLEKIERIAKCLEIKYDGVSIALQTLTNRMAVETAADHPLTIAFSKSVELICENPKIMGTSFFSDASTYCKQYDGPVILFGPGESDEAHKPNEHIDIQKYYDAIQVWEHFFEQDLEDTVWQKY